MINTVVVGVGRMGRKHVEAVIKLKELELVGIYDINPEMLKTTCEQINLEQTCIFTDLDEMINKTRPQLAIIATTAPSHLDLINNLVKKGISHILCEKPMATSLEDCEEIIILCKSNGIHLGINHQGRFLPRAIIPKGIISSEEFGGLTSMIQIGGNIGIAMNAIHTFELFEYLTGEPISSVTAWFSNEKVPNPRGPKFQDVAGNIFALSKSGKRLFLEIGADQGHGLQTIYMGRYGQLTIDEFSRECHLSVRQKDYQNEPTTRYACPSETKSFIMDKPDLVIATQKLLVELLKDGSYPDGYAGLNAVATTVSAHLSNEENHREIKISEAFNHKSRKFPWA